MIVSSRPLAAARLALAALAVLAAAGVLVTRSEALPPPARWLAWGAACLFVLLWCANSLAGLWLLSPFVHLQPGDAVVAGGQPGRVAGYGLVRLHLLTRQGWRADVPYAAVLLRPLLSKPAAEGLYLDLALRRDDWSAAEIEAVRQAAILTPYRHLSAPVQVERRGRVLRVRLRVARAGVEEDLRQLLAAAAASEGPPPRR